MSDSRSIIPISDAQAQMIEEAIKTLHGFGSFLNKALGSVPEDLVGYFGGDWLRRRRAENIVRLLGKTRERLAISGVNESEVFPAPLSMALPILRGAADEDREELADLWARLLANAMSENSIRYSFIDAVRGMDLIDVKIVDYLRTKKFSAIRRATPLQTEPSVITLEIIARSIESNSDTIEVSLGNLLSLGFLVKVDNRQDWFPTAFYREFLRACYPAGLDE